MIVRVNKLTACAASILLFGGVTKVARSGAVDIKFVHVSDTHYLENDANNTSQKTWINRLNNLPNQTMPSYGSGTVGKIWGVIHSGDIINAAGDRAAQWNNFVAGFGLTGTDGTLKHPVYEGYGNHDQDSWLTEVSSRIRTRNLTRPGVVNLHATNPHYSWNWGPVHFVHMNIRTGSSALRYNPLKSYQFLTNDLAVHVGNSGRPVIIIHHMPMGAAENEWPSAEKTEYYNAIKDYNVIAILWGHTHAFSVGRWNGIRTVNTESLDQGYTFFHITDDKLRITVRTSGNAWGGTTTDTISVPVIQPRIEKVLRDPQGGFEFEVSGDNCLDYTLESSGDFVTWSDVSTTNSLIMPLKFMVPGTGGDAVPRFFRTRLGP